MSAKASFLSGIALALAAAWSSAAFAQDAQTQAEDADALARKVSNPASFMISVPIHADLDYGDGSAGSVHRYLVDIEPVIPVRLSPNWNMISHTDFPLAYSEPVNSSGAFGLGDINQTLSFTPAKHKGLVWAIGAQASLPTATNPLLGTGKLSIGPSLLLLRQTKSMTMGVSADHLWSVAGKSDRADVSSTEVQPFVAWHIGGGRSISTNLDLSYDWKTKQWEVPLSLSYSKVMKVGGQMMSLSGGVKYWFDGPTNETKWGLKVGTVLLFPQTVQ